MLDRNVENVEILVSSKRDAVWIITEKDGCIARISGIKNLIFNGVADDIPTRSILSLSKDNVLLLYNSGGRQVGKIDFSQEKIAFAGDLHESANSLFALLKNALDPYFRSTDGKNP